MTTNLKNKITIFLMGGTLFVLTLSCWFKPVTEYSHSERRALAAFPKLTIENISSGRFMSEFETYTLDQFPLRDTFRSIKSFSALYLFQEAEVNDLYIYDGYVTKAEYPLSQPMIDNAAKKFQALYDQYMADKNVNIYLSIVPDKNYFAGTKDNQLMMDYEALVSSMKEQAPYMTYIDIFQGLNLDNYYRTDTHWKQETLLPTARTLANAMGAKLATEYTTNIMTEDFKGVYYGQLALPLKPDTIQYLTNEMLDSCIVTSYNTGMPESKEMYDLSKADSKDPYEMYLCGNDPLVTIENPSAGTDKELIIFRDSFGSSITPLLATGYKKVTLVDIRYMNSGMLGYFVNFDNQDVLFLYSTLVLNSSTSFK